MLVSSEVGSEVKKTWKTVSPQCLSPPELATLSGTAYNKLDVKEELMEKNLRVIIGEEIGSLLLRSLVVGNVRFEILDVLLHLKEE